jgi:tRNA-dihydrouridine synthase B
MNEPFVLAPLAGVSDGPFRRICREHGASRSCTEMVSAKGLYYNNTTTRDLMRIEPEEGPVGIQLFGSEPEMFAFAVKAIEDLPNTFVDINMGCPVPKVVKNGEGSALFRDPDLAAECVRACVENTKKPVTVKMRVGFSGAPDEPSAGSFAERMELAGASEIAVHARTREQYYSGKADWDKIRDVKRAVGIPVAGNGDVFSAEDAMRMLEYTGCDKVMIGRGALGNPWLFSACAAMYNGKTAPAAPDAGERRRVILEHFSLLLAAKGEYAAVRQMRSHLGWYIKGFPKAARTRQIINSCESAEELMEIIGGLS